MTKPHPKTEFGKHGVCLVVEGSIGLVLQLVCAILVPVLVGELAPLVQLSALIASIAWSAACVAAIVAGAAYIAADMVLRGMWRLAGDAQKGG